MCRWIVVDDSYLLKIFITQFESNESEDLLDAAGKYMEQVEKSFPNRTFTTAVIDVNGKHVFVTKYFKALAPPEAVLGLAEDKSMQMVRDIVPKEAWLNIDMPLS